MPPIALITAASKGMGAACARLLAQRGYSLALMARNQEVASLAKELNALAIQGDVSQLSDLKRFVAAAFQRYGRIDAVVNNTGHAAKGDLLSLTEEDWHQGFDLLVMNIIRMAGLVTPIMLKQGSGAFVNITSFAAKEPGLRFPISATLRAAVDNYAKLFSQQYAGQGLRMNNILPGWIDSYPVDEQTIKTIPANRAGTTQEVAQAVAFLLSDESRYITGQSLLVDGGLVRSV